MQPCPGRCGALVQSGYCPACRQRGRGATARKSATERGYTGKWQKYRAGYLAENPLCVDPGEVHGDVLVSATVVDHIIPHRGNNRLFWDPKNHQPLCRRCHDVKTATEDGGFGR